MGEQRCWQAHCLVGQRQGTAHPPGSRLPQHLHPLRYTPSPYSNPHEHLLAAFFGARPRAQSISLCFQQSRCDSSTAAQQLWPAAGRTIVGFCGPCSHQAGFECAAVCVCRHVRRTCQHHRMARPWYALSFHLDALHLAVMPAALSYHAC